jgi:diguanylate cyclase (GGDEF)-like protein
MTPHSHRLTQLFNFRLIPLWKQAIAAVVYVSLAYLSNFAIDPVSGFTVVWLPTGVTVGLIYIWGYPTWLGSMVGGLLTQIIFFNGLSTFPDTLLTLLIVLTGMIGQVLGVYWTVHLTNNRYFLGRAKDTTYFIICNCFLSTLFSAIIMPLTLCLLGKFTWAFYLPIALSVWLGDAFSIMSVTPLVITWHRNASGFKRLLQQQPLEGMLILFFMLVVSQIAFIQGYPVAYLLVPLIIWAAFRFGEVGATLLMVGAAAIAIIGTVRGHSVFTYGSLNSSLILLQSFIAFISITTLMLSAVLNENERAKADLKSTNAMLTQFLNALPVGVSVYGQNGATLYSNSMAEQLLKPSQDVKGSQSIGHGSICRASSSTACFPENLPAARALEGEYLLDDDLEIRQGNKVIPLEVRGTPILDEQGRVTSAIVVWQDISERKRTEAILANYTHELELEVAQRTRELANTNQQLHREIRERERAQESLDEAIRKLQKLINIDGLTQIANRRCFDERLRWEWQRAVAGRLPLSLILLDVDYFKRYNDMYGHQAGDECLVQVAQTAAQAVKRPDDLVARYGGEEFVILLPHTDCNGATLVAQRLQKTIQDLEISHEGSEVSKIVTLSMGIAQIPPEQESSINTFIHLADQALYEAKRLGRNQYVVAP